MFYLLLDILIYNFTPYLSYFSLLNLNKKSYVYNLSIALIIDTLILSMIPFNIILFSVVFLLKKYIFTFNYHNFGIYFCFNLSIIFLYYLINNLIFSYISLNNILNVLVINSIMIAISYKNNVSNIK